MKDIFTGIEFERYEDDQLYNECVDQLNVAKITEKERDFKLAIRIAEEIRCPNLRKEALRITALRLVKANEISWALQTADRLDSSKRSLILAHICKMTGDVNYLAKAENETKKISSPRMKDFISREVLNIIAN